MKDKIIKRRKELEKQGQDLVDKIKQGKDAIKNMESSVSQIQGAIQQCDWTMSQLEPENDKTLEK
jgi:vacuolar-type H+-ATPase subunit I/STV1|tara:strand:+ start:339 stop:533 length:195 start_codon:yes stop_codon:yes gene_type:complete